MNFNLFDTQMALVDGRAFNIISEKKTTAFIDCLLFIYKYFCPNKTNEWVRWPWVNCDFLQFTRSCWNRHNRQVFWSHHLRNLYVHDSKIVHSTQISSVSFFCRFQLRQEWPDGKSYTLLYSPMLFWRCCFETWMNKKKTNMTISVSNIICTATDTHTCAYRHRYYCILTPDRH